MSPTADITARLDRVWNSSSWKDTPPLGHELREYHPDRWVRFHSLPESKRYPESQSEYATILHRHHELLNDLGASGDCYLIFPTFGENDLATADSDPAFMTAIPWRTIAGDGGSDSTAHINVTTIDYPSATFDLTLRAVADDRLYAAIIAPHDLRWLYHPYDGGADVLAASSSDRDRLKLKHASWLSSHPLGL